MPTSFCRAVALVSTCLALLIALAFVGSEFNEVTAQKKKSKLNDAKNQPTGKPAPLEDPEYQQYGIYANTAPRAAETAPVETALPLQLKQGSRIALIGNTLFDRMQFFGHFETLLQTSHPKHDLVVRNLAWSADTPDLQPRPTNFADQEQHLTHEKADVIFAAYGFNESFAGKAGIEQFKKALSSAIANLKSKSFNGKTGSQIVLVSPIANENVEGVPAADLNNTRIAQYTNAMRDVAKEQRVGFVDVFAPTLTAMKKGDGQLTFNGIHLTEQGYSRFAAILFKETFGQVPPPLNDSLRKVVVDKNNQFNRRYRPVNTFYYTGSRSKSYGYLDFLPAMKNFEIMTANRDRRIWEIARGRSVDEAIDDSNVPPLPKTKESRGANRWMSAANELKEFTIDPNFEVNLFAGEEEFPDIAAPIQMRWDSQGRLWVSCSTTYPHVYPGNEPNDKLVILEDTDQDGKADKSTVFADDLNIPLSFEFGDGGVYVSEQPHFTFLKDTNGDGKADFRRIVLTGFGTEDSHHSLHDIAWTPDGDLIFRESVFHHSQVETPYGPVRQHNSGWFRFQPRDQRLISFGTYPSTNPWGVTFDDWGQHMASHPVYAAAFHALDPPYPKQHPEPTGLQAYSGVCGHEFIDMASFPADMQGGFVKVRYKPTNRVEYHRWIENEFGFEEEHVSDIIFSRNLSFIPVDLRYGPRGAMYVCDWYNPIKGHAQYSLRDERRDRHSGRIWRITARDHKLVDPPKIHGASVMELLDILKRSEYRYRYWAKRELRAMDADKVENALDNWVASLDTKDPRYRHHQIEAVWAYRNIGRVNADLLRDILKGNEHLARAAATEQLRWWYPYMPDHIKWLRKSANDPNGIVRMQAAIAASYIGSKEALDTMLDVFKQPHGKHLSYAIATSLGSHTLRRHWENNPEYNVSRLLKRLQKSSQIREPKPTREDAAFDQQPNLKMVKISCIPERNMYTMRQFAVTLGQPVKIVFTNPDATNHNLVIVKPGAWVKVGEAANLMARDPANADSDFIPTEHADDILYASPMIGPTRKSQIHVFRFNAPTEPGIYEYVCTFPGHWVIMKGEMVVARDLKDVPQMLADRKPDFVKEWTMSDFAGAEYQRDEATIRKGLQSFLKARCHQCHRVGDQGVNLGPNLTEIAKRYQGEKLLKQMIEPSSEINRKYQQYQFLMADGKVISGVVTKETDKSYEVVSNLMVPTQVTTVLKEDVDESFAAKVSAMPQGMLNGLTKEEILSLVVFLENGGP